MNLERYCHDLEANLRIRTEIAFRRIAGLPVDGHAVAEARERSADLVADAAIGDLHDAAEAGSACAASLVQAVRRLAVRVRTAADTAELQLQWLARAGQGFEVRDWIDAEARLAAVTGLEALEAERTRLEGAAALRNDFLEQLGGARARALESLPGDACGWASLAELERIRRGAERLLARSAAPYAELLGNMRERLIPHLGPEPHWSALPALLAGRALATELPRTDETLVQYLLSGLGLKRSASRLRLDLGDRGGKIAGGYWFAVVPGADVRGSWRPLGRARDYYGILRLTGACLSLCLAEPADSLMARQSADGVAAAWGAVFAALTRNPDWVESTLHRPHHAVRDHWRLQQSVRMRQLAVGAQQLQPDHDPELAVVPPGAALTAATGFRHPDLPLPWSTCPRGIRAELCGEAAAAALCEMLSTRFGSDWWRRDRCGRWLRDVWAAAHSSLAELCRDLSLRPVELGDLPEIWARRT